MGIPSVKQLKSMLTPDEFYTWTWVLKEKQKAEAGDKSAFDATAEEKIAAFRKRKGMD